MEEKSMENLISTVIDDSDLLKGGEKLVVDAFGKNKDLELHIQKDIEYYPKKDKDYSNLVDIVTLRRGKAVDDTLGVYVTDGEMYKELERIFNYKNLKTL